MDSHLFMKIFHLLIFISALCLQARADSIIFLDSSRHPYLRSRSSDIVDESDLISLSEVAAAVSVLLGFAPPASLPAESSRKLDEVLLPNPFDRPRAVFMLEIGGIKDPLSLLDQSNFRVGSAFSGKVLIDSSKAEIEISDEDELSIISLDDRVGVESDVAFFDTELHDLANWLGGSYIGSPEAMDGELAFPLASGMSLNLNLSKKADWEFATDLLSLIDSIKRVIEIHEDFPGSMQNLAELMKGRFTGIQALQEQYGPGDLVEQGMELFLTALTKSFDSLQAALEGKIVGVILFNEKSSSDLDSMLDVKFSTRTSRRLEEVEPLNATTIAEVKLVRLSLAWITGVILLVSTLIGIYYLLNMPLTRDTLLYSNVKLD
ncbi:uncharacterized protein LOC131245839 [Magnolia sinica]|uniref:uncharacterized protein LOC131245839 n=1 Tax=Magnolia sinica TaxID=86752 RepID=UPI0026588A81|nr:uncharacterized protein LOC131245839 [Magnolia sinica]